LTPQPDIAYAGFWRRLTAFILDSFLFGAGITPLLVILYGRNYFYWHEQNTDLFAFYGVADSLLTLVLPLVLIITFWVKLGATPGKLLMDCQVVDAATLQPPGWKQATLRCFAYAISAVLLYLGFLWIAFDKRKQGLHDKLAKTLVLHRGDDYANDSLAKLTAHIK
jgi:uncharacterized RDD family membrane protein YckC